MHTQTAIAISAADPNHHSQQQRQQHPFRVGDLLSLCMLGVVVVVLVWKLEQHSPDMQHFRALQKAEGESGDQSLEWTLPLFHHPIDDVIGSVLSFLTVVVGQAGGVGGGGLLVPLYLIVMKLGKFAIPLSKATILGSASTGVFMLWRKRHPQADRPLIAHEVALVLEPLTLAGTIVGVLLNTIFPQWLITVLLIVLLTFTANKAFKRGKKLWNQETLKSRVVSADKESNVKSMEVMPMTSDANVKSDQPAVDDDEAIRLNNQAALNALLEKERNVPWYAVGTIATTWVIIFVSAMLRGGHGAPSIAGIKCGSLLSWLIIVCAFGLTVTLTTVAATHLYKQYKHKVAIGYVFSKGDVRWNYRNTIVYQLVCIVAGIAAGLLGIGAGMVQSPLMLEMGVIPEVTAATSMFMVLFTSSSTTMQFLVLGMLRYDYALWYGAVGIAGAWAGQRVTDFIVRRYGRVSVVVFAVALVTALSALVMGIQGIVTAVDDYRHDRHDKLAFHRVCGH